MRPAAETSAEPCCGDSLQCGEAGRVTTNGVQWRKMAYSGTLTGSRSGRRQRSGLSESNPAFDTGHHTSYYTLVIRGYTNGRPYWYNSLAHFHVTSGQLLGMCCALGLQPAVLNSGSAAWPLATGGSWGRTGGIKSITPAIEGGYDTTGSCTEYFAAEAHQNVLGAVGQASTARVMDKAIRLHQAGA
ncbi:hypothetical protein HaLaN_28487 [Haematococcus lacustris]|uniref:Uncharacterized protein n=1 Tax=Haematococcus lacustris TaxID=44745 RepID=A0A6A0AAE0_HAELA|nr:hypothetical protein HaLaN_28487 [Haematococcus lacustris]